MNINGLKVYLCLVEELPECPHGHNLCDWGANLLEPPCGCRLRLTPLGAAPAGGNHGDGQEQDAAPLKPGR
jgi:hypothetical protein